MDARAGGDERLAIVLLGGFAVRVAGRLVPDAAWRGQKPRALVKLLALAPGSRLPRDRVLDALWPDFSPETAAQNLYSTLTVVRRALAPAATVGLGAGLLTLEAPAGMLIDATAFEAAALAALDAPDPAPCETALALYTGDLLPDDPYEDWTFAPRERLRALRLRLLRGLAERWEAHGDWRRALAALERLTASDPLDEAAHAGVMRLQALLGNRAGALRQFDALRELLARELDAEPGAATRRLHGEIATGRFPGGASGAVPPAAPAPPAVAASPPVPAPPPPDARFPLPLIGREREIAEVAGLLRAPGDGSRLVTLAGIGGVGKTRLALAAAATLPGERATVELAPLPTDAAVATVAEAVAGALGLREGPGHAPVAALVAALRDRALLLVLDNCEHLIDAVVELVAALLHACPALRILATSREALRLPGELVWSVPPLPLPDWSPPGTTEAVDPALADLAGNPSVALFVDRARRRQPGFAPNAANAPAIVAICRQLAGLPLALELAAARVGVLTVEEIAARLGDALGTLTSRERGLAPRQRSLRAALDWSYDLLSQPERVFFARLAVFVGGWDLDAAEEVGSTKYEVRSVGDEARAGDAVPRATVLGLLEALVDKSLVQVAADGAASRYRLLEPVRQYAGEQLAVMDDALARERHAAHYLALARRAEPELIGPEAARWLDRLDAERDNLRAALAQFQARGDLVAGATLGHALAHFWGARGYFAEGRHWLASFLDAGGAAGALPLELRLRAGVAAGTLAHHQGDDGAAQALLREALSLARERDDRVLVADALMQLGHIAHRAGDDAAALARYGECLPLYGALADERGVALARYGLGRAALTAGDTEAARMHFAEARSRFERLGDRAEVARAHFGMAMVERERGDDGAARDWFERALAHRREIGHLPGVSLVLAYLGDIAARQGEPERARDWLVEGLTLALRQDIRQNIAYALEGFAALAVAEGEPTRALRLAGAASALRAAIGAPLYPRWQARLDDFLAPARAALGALADAAWADGAALSQAAAVAEALADTPNPSG